jgi:pimeloyl-ACP methyl ester carboxylesterase
MATFVLVPGAGGVAWYWHRVVPLLEEAKHDAIAVDLPGDDEQAGLPAYSDRVVEAIGRREVVLVVQSLGGFTAPLVCARVRVRMLVFVNAMIPLPGEMAGEWWDNTGSTAARIAAAQRGGYSTNFDLATYFLHDVPLEIIKQGEAHQRPEADIVLGEPCLFEAWPEVPIHVIAGRDDRFFPIDFQRRVARERLHVTVDELAGGHLVALSNPCGLVTQFLSYLQTGARS